MVPKSLHNELAGELDDVKRELQRDAIDLRYFDSQVLNGSMEDLETLSDPTDTMGPRLSELGRYVESAEESVRNFRDFEERRYEVVTWTSYVLYTLGWFLAFAGRIMGVGDVAVE